MLWLDCCAILLVLLTTDRGHCFVIAPPWADPATNPCSRSSWQLVYWPPTNNCYQIFSQGPCPDTQELGYNPLTSSPECRCPHNLPLHWPHNDQCYAEFSRGPCDVNQYLAPVTPDNVTAVSAGVTSAAVECVTTERCDPGSVFWPPDQQCYSLYTQGPCHKGDLILINPDTAEPYCGCDPLLLNQYFYKPMKLCYEHFTKGPCEFGSVFTYNHTSDTTDCVCQQSFPNYFPPLGQCFEIETKGPCGKGQVFRYDSKSKRSGCQCKEKYVYWEKTHSCYREFTPGPCKSGQFLVKGLDGVGFCSKNPCSTAHLYFPSAADPSQGHCHKVGGQGPCPLGELVVFESYSGKSYRGDCGCSPGYNQNYWPADNKCYEWFSQGPCQPSFMFRYNKEERRTECQCDTAAGFVFWNETQRCYRVYTQGPCPDNAWLIPTGDMKEVYCECKNGFYFSQNEYMCRRSQTQPSPRNFLRNHQVPTIGRNNTNVKNNVWSQPETVGRGRFEGSRPSDRPIALPRNSQESPATGFGHFWDSKVGQWSQERRGRRIRY